MYNCSIPPFAPELGGAAAAAPSMLKVDVLVIVILVVSSMVLVVVAVFPESPRVKVFPFIVTAPLLGLSVWTSVRTKLPWEFAVRVVPGSSTSVEEGVVKGGDVGRGIVIVLPLATRLRSPFVGVSVWSRRTKFPSRFAVRVSELRTSVWGVWNAASGSGMVLPSIMTERGALLAPAISEIGVPDTVKTGPWGGKRLACNDYVPLGVSRHCLRSHDYSLATMRCGCDSSSCSWKLNCSTTNNKR